MSLFRLLIGACGCGIAVIGIMAVTGYVPLGQFASPAFDCALLAAGVWGWVRAIQAEREVDARDASWQAVIRELKQARSNKLEGERHAA